jgi:hypothetical protein
VDIHTVITDADVNTQAEQGMEVQQEQSTLGNSIISIVLLLTVFLFQELIFVKAYHGIWN